MNRRFKFLVMIIIVILSCFAISNIFHLDQIFSQNKLISNNKRGNTSGNNINCGYAGQVGDWIYYSSLVQLSEPGIEILCRENIKNGKKERVSNDIVRNINILGGWIYFGINDPAGNGPICRMKLDGSGKMELSNDKYEFINVVGDYIYYVNFSDGAQIYRMKTNGSERKKMNDSRSWSINVIDGWIYFGSNKNINKMPVNGGQTIKILSEDGLIGLMIVDKEWIYYFKGDQGNLYKVGVNGTGKMLLSNDVTDNFNIAGNYIYYDLKINNTSFIYRMDLNGKNKTRIAKGSIGNIIGNWIYSYEDYQEFQVPVRIKTDGTSREIIHFK